MQNFMFAIVCEFDDYKNMKEYKAKVSSRTGAPNFSSAPGPMCRS